MEKHYMRIVFGVQKDRSPEIYDFLFKHLPQILSKLKFKHVDLDIQRLESLNSIYTNLDHDEDEIKKIFNDFVKSHHLKKAAALNAEMDKTSVKAELLVEKLAAVLQDYNTLFDIFFTDTIVHVDHELTFDMMDAFNNSLLVSGSEEHLAEVQKLTKQLAQGPVEFKMVDHEEAKKVSRKR
jgi:hypothetical protein